MGIIHHRSRSVCTRTIVFLTFLIAMSSSRAMLMAETVLHVFTAASPDSRFERLLYLAAGTELLKMGVSSRIDDGEAAGYSLSAEYSVTEGLASISYSLSPRDPSDTRRSAEKLVLPINSSFDTAVATAVRGLVSRAGIVFARDPDAYIDGVLALPLPSDVLIEANDVESRRSEEAMTGIEAELITTAEEPVGKPEPAVGELRDGSSYELTASAFGMAFLGGITQYIHYGAGSEIYAGFYWPLDNWTISAGAKAGGARAFNDPDVSGGPLGVWTAQASLRFGASGSPGTATASVSAGAAVLTVGSADGAKNKTVPCVDAGISALLPIGKGFSLGLGVGFQALFDELFIPAIISSIILRWGV